MKYNFSKYILVVILVISFILRALGYAQYPKPGSSFDEFGNTFVGMSLVKIGYPIGFTTLTGYKNEKITNFLLSETKNKVLSYNIVHPWFDHPPLLCLVTGGWVVVNGINKFGDLTINLIRQPMILLGVLTVLLIYLLAKELFGDKIGLWSAFLAAVIPIMVIGSRTAQAENLLIPLSLTSLLFLKKYLDKQKFWYLLLSGFFLTLAMLTKISGVFLFISIILIILHQKLDKKEKLFAILITMSFFVFGLLIYFVQGFCFDPKSFVVIFLANGNRNFGLGFDYLYYILTNEEVTIGAILRTGFNLVLWISFFVFCIKKIKYNSDFIIIPLVVYLSVLILFGSYRYGWYTFPLYPFLVISSACAFEYLYKKKSYLVLFFFNIIILSTLMSQIIDKKDIQIYKNYWRYPVFILFLFVLIVSNLVNKKTSRGVLKIIIFLLGGLIIIQTILYLFLTKRCYFKMPLIVLFYFFYY